MLKLTLLALTLLSPIAHAADGPADELRSLRNVINNSIPEKYRGQLNGSLNKLESAINSGCSASPAPNGAPACRIEYHSNGFYKLIKKDGADLTAWTRNVDETLAHFDALAAAGQCAHKLSAEPCSIEFHSNGFYAVKRGSEQISAWDRTMNNTIELLAKYKKRGICQ